MKLVIFGATGMVGRGALLEALDSERVTSVLAVGRHRVDLEHPKLRQLVHEDFEDFGTAAEQLRGLDACLWCLGVPSQGLDEASYTRITHDFTVAAAEVLLKENPEFRFCFVSGAGTDETEKGRPMWARVKGKTENALTRMGFVDLVIFRPAFIRPQRGSQPRGALYRLLYVLFVPLIPILRALGSASTTVEVGRAMVAAALGMATKKRLNTKDINQLAAKLAPATEMSTKKGDPEGRYPRSQ